jgi:hypothetical protein
VRWPEASRAQRAIRLDEVGLRAKWVVFSARDAARDNPALRDALAACESDAEREQVAFEWFETHPQPTHRELPGPDWPGGRLPPFEDPELHPAAERGTVAAGGKKYRGDDVERVVGAAHRARLNGRELGRTLRNDIHDQEQVSTYMVDTVFRLMRRDPPVLADAGRKGWLKVAGQVSATPAFIDLHELETRS